MITTALLAALVFLFSDTSSTPSIDFGQKDIKDFDVGEAGVEVFHRLQGTIDVLLDSSVVQVDSKDMKESRRCTLPPSIPAIAAKVSIKK